MMMAPVPREPLFILDDGFYLRLPAGHQPRTPAAEGFSARASGASMS